MAYHWSARPEEPVVRRIPDDRPTWFISDLHLGNGAHSDIFMGKDRQLMALLEEVRDRKGRLVVMGDAIDFHQSWNFTHIVEAHGKLLKAMGEVAEAGGLLYLAGNHDDDIRVYRDILRFDVCSRLWIGDDIAVQHGHEFDPYIGPNLEASHRATRMHHWAEHNLRVFIRLPIGDFYNWGNRVALWLAWHAWCALKLRNKALRALGATTIADRSEQPYHHWIRSEAGDPVGMTRPAIAWGKANGAKVVICGHSHMPGNLVHDGVRYCNTGSWTFGWGQYLRYQDGVFTVKDWLTGKEYRDELYRPLLDGDLDALDFDKWWRNQYLGWFRYRSGELKRRMGG